MGRGGVMLLALLACVSAESGMSDTWFSYTSQKQEVPKDYATDQKMMDALLDLQRNQSGPVPQALGWTPRSYLIWRPTGIGGIDYEGLGFSPGKLNGKKIYICQGDETYDRRPMGITWAEGTGAEVFKKCYYAWKKPTENSVVIGEISGVWGNWAVLMDYQPNLPTRITSQYKWGSTSATVNQCYNLEKAAGQRPPGTICPRVTGNYGETASGIGFKPYRYACMWREGTAPNVQTYIGASDARKTDNPADKIDNNCYSWKWQGGQRVPYKRTLAQGYKVLVLRNQDVTEQHSFQPAYTCGAGCRAEGNYPQGYWPGIAGKDIVEGSMYLAHDVASCCHKCRTTPGCMGYTFSAKGQRWCWLKWANCFPEDHPEKCPFPPPPANLGYCKAEFPTYESYGAMLRAADRAAFSVGTCKSAVIYDQKELGSCGVLSPTVQPTMAACCKACENFNIVAKQNGSGDRCHGWSWAKVVNTCFLRSEPRASCETHMDKSEHVVSGFLKAEALLLP